MPVSITPLIVIICILAIGVLFLFFFARHYKTKSDKEHKDYKEFVGEIEKKEEIKRQTATRRRITAKMKQAVLERDNCTCQICGISKGFIDSLLPGLGDYLLLEIDHIESVANGGTGKDEDNLQVLCWRCNRKKGSKKTNEQVKESIDYGIEYLERNRLS